MKIRSLAASLALLSTPALSGCTQLSESYAGKDRNVVWTAMVASAELPGYYPDWIITENNVWSDAAGARIEVDRVLRRDYIRPRQRPQREERHMQFSIYLLEDKAGDPEVEFTSRRLDVPIKARDEATMYFDAVWDILGGRPEPMPEEQEIDAIEFTGDEVDESTNDAATEDDIVDVDDLSD